MVVDAICILTEYFILRKATIQMMNYACPERCGPEQLSKRFHWQFPAPNCPNCHDLSSFSKGNLITVMKSTA
jgi:hypothetical protein